MRILPIQENKSCWACLKDYKDDLHWKMTWKMTSIDENCANKTQWPIVTGKEDTEQQEFSVS